MVLYYFLSLPRLRQPKELTKVTPLGCRLSPLRGFLFKKTKIMKEKFDFIYRSVEKAINDLNTKKITVEHAKAIASLAKQSNNVIATQLDAAKFMSNFKDSEDQLIKTGLIDESKG